MTKKELYNAIHELKYKAQDDCTKFFELNNEKAEKESCDCLNLIIDFMKMITN